MIDINSKFGQSLSADSLNFFVHYSGMINGDGKIPELLNDIAELSRNDNMMIRNLIITHTGEKFFVSLEIGYVKAESTIGKNTMILAEKYGMNGKTIWNNISSLNP